MQKLLLVAALAVASTAHAQIEKADVHIAVGGTVASTYTANAALQW